MADAFSEHFPGTSYRWTRTICFDDILTKFSNQEVIWSDESFCQYDPHPTTFRTCTKFGTKAGYLSAYIQPVSENVITVQKFVKISVYDEGGKLLSTRTKSGSFDVTSDGGVGFHKLHKFDAATTESSLRMVFEIEYLAASDSDWELDSEYDSDDELPKLRLQKDLRHLLESGEQSDVTFDVQGEKICAHKIILTTRCEYFKSMFDSSMVESASKEVVVPDVKPKSFRGLLSFIYTDVAPKYEGESTMELLSAADKYGVDDLKKTCETAICSHLNAENVVDALLLADRHHCPSLMVSAKAVFGSHASALKDEWNKLKESPTLLLDLLKHFCL